MVWSSLLPEFCSNFQFGVGAVNGYTIKQGSGSLVLKEIVLPF